MAVGEGLKLVLFQPRRGLVWLMVGAWFSIAGFGISGAGGESFAATVAPGGSGATAWVNVGAGNEIHWRVNATAYVDLSIEVAGRGVIEADDAYGLEGCARATESVNVRALWANRQGITVDIRADLDTVNTSSRCPSVEELLALRAEQSWHYFSASLPYLVALAVSGAVVLWEIRRRVRR